jgi:hypothetical protein
VDDIFVVKLSPDGKTALFSTLLGWSCYDRPTSIALDTAGQIYVTGETDSTDFPAVSNLETGPASPQFASLHIVVESRRIGLGVFIVHIRWRGPDSGSHTLQIDPGRG